LGSLRDQAISFPTTVTGEFLAKNRLSKRARAQLAADIISGKVRVADFTIKQAAALCSVSVAYINEARAPDPAVAKLLRDWNEAGPNQRVAFARAANAERIFDVLVPAID